MAVRNDDSLEAGAKTVRAPGSYRKLNIFVHRASECLTDHDAHGDGLICFSLLNGLAKRGHHIYAYANRAPISTGHANLRVRTAQHLVPANALSDWEHSWRAEQWLRGLVRQTDIDIVWRMHPYGSGCPYPPRTQGRPLVVGPLFHGWPEHLAAENEERGRPRLGIGIAGMVKPFAVRGWEATLRRAQMVLCGTEELRAEMASRYPGVTHVHAPVIIDAPVFRDAPGRSRGRASPCSRLIFIGHLVKNKNPRVFVDTIRLLLEQGFDVEGVVLGDGPEREALAAYCAQYGLRDAISLRGKLPHHEVWRELGRADLLVSCSGFEAYGRAIAEAMALGVPCICYAGSGGPSEIITPGVDGLLTETLSAEAYANAIRPLLRSAARRATISRNALRAAERWRGDVVLSDIEQALTSICERGLG